MSPTPDPRAGQTININSGSDIQQKPWWQDVAKHIGNRFGDYLVSNLLPGAGNLPGLAEGGVVTKPTMARVGEEGPEARVPLNGRRYYGE